MLCRFFVANGFFPQGPKSSALVESWKTDTAKVQRLSQRATPLRQAPVFNLSIPSGPQSPPSRPATGHGFAHPLPVSPVSVAKAKHVQTSPARNSFKIQHSSHILPRSKNSLRSISPKFRGSSWPFGSRCHLSPTPTQSPDSESAARWSRCSRASGPLRTPPGAPSPR